MAKSNLVHYNQIGNSVLTELETTGRIHCTLIYRGTEENCKKSLKIQEDYLISLEPDTDEPTEPETETEVSTEAPTIDEPNEQDEQEVMPNE